MKSSECFVEVEEGRGASLHPTAVPLHLSNLRPTQERKYLRRNLVLTLVVALVVRNFAMITSPSPRAVSSSQLGVAPLPFTSSRCSPFSPVSPWSGILPLFDVVLDVDEPVGIAGARTGRAAEGDGVVV
jgi:hypothetical protein